MLLELFGEVLLQVVTQGLAHSPGARLVGLGLTPVASGLAMAVLGGCCAGSRNWPWTALSTAICLPWWRRWCASAGHSDLPDNGLMNPRMHVRIWALWLLMASSLLLAGCPNSLSELLNESQLHSVSASPNPVPAPTSQASSAFNLNVSFDSNNDSDVLLVYVRDPHDRGNFRFLREAAPCPNRSSGGNCGNGSAVIGCFSYLSQFHSGERTVNCGVGANIVDLPPGDHTLRVEIIQHLSLGMGYASSPDDSYEITLTVR